MIPNNPTGGGGGKVDVHVTPGTPTGPISDLLFPRIAPAVTRLGVGVLFAGGNTNNQSNGQINTAEVCGIDLLNHRVSDLSTQVQGAAAATDGLGRAIIAGGLGLNMTTNVASVDRYDTSGVRTSLPPLSSPRHMAKGATDGNGAVLIIGGYAEGSPYGTRSAMVERYDLAGVRTTLPPLAVAKAYMAVATNGKGEVLVGGGGIAASPYGTNTVEKYDKDGNKSTLEPLRTPRVLLAAATLGNGDVVFAGGANPSTGERLGEVDCYAVSNDARRTLEPLSFGTSGLCGCTNGNGEVVFAGGTDGSNRLYGVVNMYDATGNKMADPKPLSVARKEMGAAMLGDGSVLFGGGDTYYQSASNTGAMATVDRYAIDKKGIMIPAFNVYKFEEHAEEQPFFAKDTYVAVKTPNTGYFKQKRGTTVK